MLEQTGCDAVMIARGAIGDPLIFKRTLSYLKTGKLQEPSFKDSIKSFKDYLKLSKKHKFQDIEQIKRIGCKFIKNTIGASKMRAELMQLKTFEDIEVFVKGI